MLARFNPDLVSMLTITTRERLLNLIWPALLLAMIVALGAASEASSCPAKRQLDGCQDVGCSGDVDLWSGLRLYYAPPAAPTSTATLPSSELQRPLPTATAAVRLTPTPPLTVLAVAPKTSPPA